MQLKMSNIMFLTLTIIHIGCQNLTKTTPVSLESKIGQMVMVGFRETQITPNDAIYSMIKNKNLGGVVLYNRDLPSQESIVRNIKSPTQLKNLIKKLQSISPGKLLISIDEEGGLVSRLDEKSGFLKHKSHKFIGEYDNMDTTKMWAKEMATELSNLGINMNFAPVLDLNLNPKNPIIGMKERSFSDNANTVIKHGRIFVKEHNLQNILCVPKHFPGHGSSDSDSHKGLTDVTKTWSLDELIPFKELIKDKTIDVIMTSHIYNERLDTLPSTLSPKIISQLLREDFGFNGVIISDDMQMRAISSFYNFETAIEKAINSGVDILLFSNNAAPCRENVPGCQELFYDENLAEKTIQHITKLVLDGHISEKRIDKSYQRILKMKSKID